MVAGKAFKQMNRAITQATGTVREKKEEISYKNLGLRIQNLVHY